MLQTEQIIQERYQLKQQLGDHASRQTWLVEDLANHHQLAIAKFLAFCPQTNWDEVKLFQREAQILQQLQHPHIPKYRDYFALPQTQEWELPWFVLIQDYIPGNSLQQLLKSGKIFTESEAKWIAVQLLQILIYLHELSPPVLHRDLKPSNIIWGKDEQIYLVDFGSVQEKAKAEGVTFTIVGTDGYAPPEQLWGRAIASSDLYGLGATLIHLLTGIAPGDLPQEKMQLKFLDRVKLSSRFANWIEKLIAPAIERRFPRANQALAILETIDVVYHGEEIGTINSRSNKKFNYEGVVTLILIQGIVLLLIMLAGPSFNAMYWGGFVGQGRRDLNSINQKQKDYYETHGKFIDSLFTTFPNLKAHQRNYDYSSLVTPWVTYTYGISRWNSLDSLVGANFVIPANSDQVQVISIVCNFKSDRSKTLEPMLKDGYILCPRDHYSIKYNTTDNPNYSEQVEKNWTLARDAFNYTSNGKLEQALIVAHSISHPYFQALTLNNIAIAQAQQGQLNQATTIFSQAQQVAAEIKDPESKAWVLINLASSSNYMGLELLANPIFSETIDLAKTIKKSKIQAAILSTITDHYIALKQYDSALSVAEIVPIVANKTLLLIAIAQGYLDHQQNLLAKSVISTALSTAQSIEYADTQAKMLLEIGSIYANLAQADLATNIFEQAVKVAQNIADNSSKASILVAIANAAAESGFNSQAAQIYTQGVKLAETFSNREQSARYYLMLANLKQQDFYQKNHIFANFLEELNFNNVPQPDHYIYSVTSTAQATFIYAIAINPNQDSHYIGAVFLPNPGIRAKIRSIVCESELGSINNPTDQNGKLTCGNGTRDVSQIDD